MSEIDRLKREVALLKREVEKLKEELKKIVKHKGSLYYTYLGIEEEIKPDKIRIYKNVVHHLTDDEHTYTIIPIEKVYRKGAKQ